MKVDVLGTVYTVHERTDGQDPKLRECDGYCDESVKEIVIDNYTSDQEALVKADLNRHKRKVMRHELIHAFLTESGLRECSWAKDEEIVDWIASQFPKLAKAFKDAGCEE